MIGVFDSGIGGLHTLKEILNLLPNYSYIYLGDNGNSPYGSKTKEKIIELTEKGVKFLIDKGAKFILLACNTVSGITINILKDKYPEVNFYDVIEPSVLYSIKNSRYGRIGLVGTTSTIENNSFGIHFEKLKDNFVVNKKSLKTPILISKTCPLLVPLIEEGWTKKPETKSILKKYLLPLKSNNIDTLILGCTHYAFLEKEFNKKMGNNVKIVNSGKILAESFFSDIKNNLNDFNKTYSLEIYTTGSIKQFRRLGQSFLGRGIGEIDKITL
jgi:glutamate racemase